MRWQWQQPADVHCSHDADIPVGAAAQGAKDQRLAEARGEAEAQAGQARAQQADEQDRLAAGAGGVGDAAPCHGRQELRRHEGGVQDACLPGYEGVGGLGAEPLQLVVHV